MKPSNGRTCADCEPVWSRGEWIHRYWCDSLTDSFLDAREARRERVAKAIFDSVHRGDSLKWEAAPKPAQGWYQMKADAAIAAYEGEV